MGKKASIIIRCFNEEEHIGRLLSGLVAQNEKDFEIIVVDSGSTDATLAIASRFPVKIIHINPEDFSFGYALNVGCEQATGEYLVFASAHVYPLYKDWLRRMIAPFSNSKVGLVYGKQRGPETAHYSEKQIFIRQFPDDPHVHTSHPFANNANTAIPRELWEVTPYDETLTGLEDLQWAKQVVEAGYHVVYEPRAEIIHVHNETAKQIFNRHKREAIALKHIYDEEKFNFLDLIRLLTTNIISDYCHALLDGELVKNLFGIPRFRWFQFSGTYSGFIHHGRVTSGMKRRFYYPNGLVRAEKKEGGKEQDRLIDYDSIKFETGPEDEEAYTDEQIAKRVDL